MYVYAAAAGPAKICVGRGVLIGARFIRERVDDSTGKPKTRPELIKTVARRCRAEDGRHGCARHAVFVMRTRDIAPPWKTGAIDRRRPEKRRKPHS